jgi:hypothetical protein
MEFRCTQWSADRKVWDQIRSTEVLKMKHIWWRANATSGLVRNSKVQSLWQSVSCTSLSSLSQQHRCFICCLCAKLHIRVCLQLPERIKIYIRLAPHFTSFLLTSRGERTPSPSCTACCSTNTTAKDTRHECIKATHNGLRCVPHSSGIKWMSPTALHTRTFHKMKPSLSLSLSLSQLLWIEIYFLNITKNIVTAVRRTAVLYRNTTTTTVRCCFLFRPL